MEPRMWKLWIASIIINIVCSNGGVYAHTNFLNTQCAQFTPTVGPQAETGSILVLKDLDVIGSSIEEYMPNRNSWNVAGVWSVNSGCKLNVCDDAYLSGNCTEYEGSSSTPRNWLSAQCECSKECKCNETHLRQAVCARAYINPDKDTCNDCNSTYTELEPSSEESFNDEWQEKISSILVRPGCTLTLYEEEDFEGDSTVLEGSSAPQEWDKPLGSYECGCTSYTPRERSQVEGGQFPSVVDVPLTLDEVAEKFAESNYAHPGLKAALESLLAGRSSRNAYILFLGSTGAGKSSTINILLGSPNVTISGDFGSTTSEILEFRIPLPVPSLGLGNSELRIIDTPGLGDTNGVDRDALFLATLDDYLSKHEELKNKPPNLVLILHKFTDNRFDGENSKFVKMIRGLNTMREKITDENFSNVIFLFTHFCSATPKNRKRNPTVTLASFRDVINNFSLFPKPLFTSVAENKGKDNNLPMKMGNFKLPNMEYFPRNLIQKFETITNSGNDSVGNAIINRAFLSNQDLQVETAVRHQMVSSSHSKVAAYLSSLSKDAYNIGSSEISKLLEQSYMQMDSTLKTSFPNSLESLQKFFNLRNIRSKTDLPQTSLTILKLLKSIPNNNANNYLVENGLELKAPMLPLSGVVGYGYHVFSNLFLPSSPFKQDKLGPSCIGFMIPKIMNCVKFQPYAYPKNQAYSLNVLETKREYFDFKLESLFGHDLQGEANTTEMFEAITSKIEPGFYVKDASCDPSSECTFVVTRFYKQFQLKLKPDAAPTSNFNEKLDALSPFDTHDPDNVDAWKRFFDEFGTHIVDTVEGGGRMDFQFTIQKATVFDSVKKVIKVLDLAEDPLESMLEGKVVPKRVFEEAGAVRHTLKFHGGNPAYYVPDFSKLSLEEARNIMKNWKQSLEFYPAIFPSEVIPLTKVLEKSLSQKDAITKLGEAYSYLINSTLTYIPPPPPTPDPKILEEIERQKKEQEEKIKKLLEEKERAEEAERERQRLAKLEEERLLEEARRKEEQRLQQEQEAERKRKQEELERQMYQEMLREMQENQRRLEEADRQRRIREMEEAARRERERIWREAPPPPVIYRKRNSCLKKGSKILLTDFSEKNVEDLVIGDEVLDKDLNPTKVLGVSYEFLMNQNFYGFDNRKYFFTDSHLFMGPSFDLYTVDTERLFAQNPLLQYLNITQFDETGSGDGFTNLLYFEKGTEKLKPPEGKPFRIYKDPRKYDESTPIYFIQVDNPSGTYIVEGFVSRHEVPPMTYWPNTMPVLFPLLNTESMKLISEMPYTIDAVHLIDKVSDDLKVIVWDFFKKRNYLRSSYEKSRLILAKNVNNSEIKRCSQERLHLDDFNLDEVVGKIFGNPMMAALGMEIYGGTGSIISIYLDNPRLPLDDCEIKRVQKSLLDEITEELNMSIKRRFLS